MQVDNHPVRLQPFTICGSDDYTAAGREHDVRHRGELDECRLLTVPEARFAFDLENRRDGNAEPALELRVGVDERLAEPPRELAAERGLARAGQSDQKQIAPMQMHRGIVVETVGPDETEAIRYLTAVTVSFTTRGVRKISNSCFSLPRVVVLKR